MSDVCSYSFPATWQVRFNLMTSDWYDESHRESLLNAGNTKRAQQTLNNLRMSCNVAGNCVLQVGEMRGAFGSWLAPV